MSRRVSGPMGVHFFGTFMKNFAKLAVHFTEYKRDLNQLEIKRYLAKILGSPGKLVPKNRLR